MTRLGVYASNLVSINLSDYFALGFFSIISGIIGSIIGNKLLKKVTIEFIRFLVAILILVIAFGLLLGIL